MLLIHSFLLLAYFLDYFGSFSFFFPVLFSFSLHFPLLSFLFLFYLSYYE